MHVAINHSYADFVVAGKFWKRLSTNGREPAKMINKRINDVPIYFWSPACL